VSGGPAAEVSGRQPGAVHGALSVLEEVARAGPGVTAQQISAALGLPRATAYRLINLLVQDEYLVRLPDLTGFALGRKVSVLAELAARSAPHERPADIVAEMRGRIRGGVHLASFRSGALELVDVDPDFPLADAGRVVRDLSSSALGGLLAAEQRQAPVAFVTRETVSAPGRGCFAAALRDTSGALLAGVALSLPAPRLAEPQALLELIEPDCRRLEAALR